jgi:hypothetical protein
MLTRIPAIESVFGPSATGSSDTTAKRPARYAAAVAAGFIAFAALGVAGSAPALAQAQSHDAAMLPHYYDAEGGQHFGSWSAPATEQKRTVSAVVKPAPSRVAQLHRFR